MELIKAEKLTFKLLKKYNLSEWSFSFDSAVRRFGCCKHSKKQITLSKKLTMLRDEKNVKNTILHEIAHALVGPGHGHDEVWRSKALSIGCDGKRCGNDVSLVSKWVGICPAGHRHNYHRKPTRNKSCGICYPKYYNESFKLKFIQNEVKT